MAWALFVTCTWQRQQQGHNHTYWEGSWPFTSTSDAAALYEGVLLALHERSWNKEVQLYGVCS